MRGLHCRMGWIIEFKIPICVKGGGGWEFIGMTELNKWTSSIRGHAGTPTVGLPNWLASSQVGYTDEYKNKCLYIYMQGSVAALIPINGTANKNKISNKSTVNYKTHVFLKLH